MKKLVFILFLAGILFSCKEDENKTPNEENNSTPELKARVNLMPTYQGNPVSLNEEYTTQEGYTISFTRVDIIFTNFKNNNGKQLFESAIYKMNEDKRLLWKGKGNYSEFNSIAADVGVGPAENHEDPSAREQDDPLFILNSGEMHWGWNPGYIFIMLEGKADTTVNQTGNDLMNFFYHIGEDTLLQHVSITDLNWQKESKSLYSTTLKLDLYKVFDGDTQDVDIKAERKSHTLPSEMDLSKRVIENLTNAISK